MAKGEQQDDGTRGGVSTITRTGDRRARDQPGRPARPVPAPRPTADPGPSDPRRDPRQLDPRRAGTVGAPWRVPPAERRAGARPAQGTQPAEAPAGLRPRPQAQPGQPGLPAAGGPHRMPFVLLLCGLLGGALVSALVISTTLAEGSFEITKLQTSTTSLARQRQVLEDQVAQAQSAPVIAAKAAKLGLREVSELRFFDVKTGKITTDAGATQSYIPGYMP